MGRRVLVTGGAGFIGSHLVERIARDRPRRLVVVDNLFLGSEANLADARRLDPELKLYAQDAADYDALGAIIAAEGIDVVFNLAIVPLPASLVNPRWTVDHNIALTTVPCELQRQGYFETLVHFSSSEAYGSAAYVPMDESHPSMPSTPYAASKVAGDYIVLSYRETYGVDASIVRPFNNFGPRQNAGAYAGIIPIVVGRALRGEPIVIYGDGEQTRDFVFAGDVAEAFERAATAQGAAGHVVNVGSGDPVSVNRLLAVMNDVLGARATPEYREARMGDIRASYADATKAERLLGFRAKVSLAQGLLAAAESLA